MTFQEYRNLKIHMGSKRITSCGPIFITEVKFSRAFLTSILPIHNYFTPLIFIIAYDILNNATNGRKTKAILWTSGLTGSDEGRRLLSPDKFIIQIWDGISHVLVV